MTFLTLIADGFFLDLEPRGLHTFCGPHSVPGAHCPTCDLPLHRYLELDTRDAQLSLSSTLPALIPLLFCWRCNIAQQPFYYQLRGTGVELLVYGTGIATPDFPYKNYPDSFPGSRGRLRPLTPFESAAIVALNQGADSFAEPYRTLARPAHQVGGTPILVQDDYHDNYSAAATCPICAAAMPFLAAFGDRCLDSRGFVNNDYVQTIFSMCPEHKVVSAHQACD